MTVTINGTTGVTTPDVTSDSYTGPISVSAAAPDNSVVVDASGNLLLGTTSGTGKLVVSDATDPVIRLQNTKNGSWTTGDAFGELYFYSSDTSGAGAGDRAFIKSVTADAFGASSAMSFGIAESGGNATEKMRIDQSGNLLVGTTSVPFAGILQIYKSNNDGMTSKTDTAINNVPYFAWNATTSGDSQWHRFYTETSATQRGSIDYNRASNVTRYNTTSDATLKNIIGDAPADKSVQILETTKIREYSWKADTSNKPQIGVIAQELYETFGGAVSVGGDMQKTDAEGNVSTEYVPWSVDKTAFTFHLVRGWQEHQRIIQEQQAIIDSLTTRIAALEAK